MTVMNEPTDWKYREYYERHSYWQNIAISHMSFSINLFLTISLAFLGFIVNSSNMNNIDLIFSVTEPDPGITLIFISVIMGGLSILYGILSVLTRIADFNLTRNVVYTRKLFYSKKNDVLKTEKVKRKGNWFSIILNTKKYLISSEFIRAEEKDAINKELTNLIYWKEVLGGNTWFFHKIQIGSFACMMIFWIISVLIN